MENQQFPALKDQSDLYLKNRYFTASKFLRSEMEKIAEESGLSKWDSELIDFKNQVEQTLTLTTEQIRSAIQFAEEAKDTEFSVLDFWVVFTIANRHILDLDNKLVEQYSTKFDQELWMNDSLNIGEDEYSEHSLAYDVIDSDGPVWLQDLNNLAKERGLKNIETYVVRQHDNYVFKVQGGGIEFNFIHTYYNKGTFYSTNKDIVSVAQHLADTDVNSFDSHIIEWEHGDGKSSWQGDFTEEPGSDIINGMISKIGEYEFFQDLIYQESGKFEYENDLYSFELIDQFQEYTVGNQFLTDEHDHVTGFVVKFGDGSTAEVSFDSERWGTITVKEKQPNVFDLFLS